ncbi:MAG: hypothetical protein M1817_001781 [Caeruleum heppii]|nr:MAG: hypothetical protein M1817_001781 [Caeruleum heppii]
MSSSSSPHGSASDGFIDQCNSVVSTMFSYVKLPVIASSGVAAALSGLLYFKQNELIYPRNLPSGSRTQIPQPSDFNFHDFETLSVPTPDGEYLSGFLLRPSNAAHTRPVTILMFHGNAGNIGHRVPIGIKIQEDLDCNVLMLEYRGYGASTGTPDEQGLMIDAQTGLDYIRKRADLKDTKIVIYGQSLGGALSIALAAKNQEKGIISGLVLENTFTSMRKLIPSAFPPARYLARLCHQIWPSEALLPTITPTLPILFLSGRRDEIVPPSHMTQLYRLSRAKTKIWHPLPEGTHNESILQPGYFEALRNFVVNVVIRGRALEELEGEKTEERRSWETIENSRSSWETNGTGMSGSTGARRKGSRGSRRDS